MKALGKLKPEPGIWLYEASEPSLGPNDVLIKINKAAICGTDLHIYNWDNWAAQNVKLPLTIGHEFIGTIIAVGDNVSTFKIGERISGESQITCKKCRNCLIGRQNLCYQGIGVGITFNGCFAEYISLPADNIFRVPDDISDDVASILDPLGNAVHVALTYDLVGENVLIIGAGPIGIMAAVIARYIGARHIVITDINDYRLNLAKQLGVTAAVNVNHTNISDVMNNFGIKDGFGVCLELSGHQSALQTILKYVIHGGNVAILGIPPNETQIDWSSLIFKGLTLKGIYGRKIFDTWFKMISLLQGGLNVAPLITHHFSFNEYQNAFDLLKLGLAGKIILDFD